MAPSNFMLLLCNMIPGLRSNREAPSPAPSSVTAKDSTDEFTPSTEQNELPKALQGTSVRMPNLFVDVMAAPYARCPAFEKVKAEADGWLADVLNEPKKSQYYVKANLVLLAALWLPKGDASGLRMLADWNHWSFPFDDQFDEGHLKHDTVKAIDEVFETMAMCDEETHPPVSAEESPIGHVFQAMWLQYKERTSINQQDLFRQAHRQYFAGLIKQTLWAGDEFSKTKPTAEEYMVYRRECLGGWPTLVVAEAAMGIDLPRNVRGHPAVAACGLAMTDIVIIDNDILSMKKDLKYGVKHNLIIRLIDLGLTMQQAMDHAGEMLDECYRSWHTNRALIPKGSWGETIDQDVERLLEVWRDITLGSLWWSFESGRYFGEKGDEVKRTGIILL